MSNDIKDKILYGGFTPIEKNEELALASFGYILNDVKDIKNSYIRLGFHLRECKLSNYYQCFGYVSFEDFAYYNFGLDKSALSRIISVYEKFCAVDKSAGYVSRKMWLDEKYTDYSYSQLCEMVPLNIDEVKNVTPDMTIKEIRDYKKSLKNKRKEIVDVVPVATSQQKDTFDYRKFQSVFGAVRMNYVKSVASKEFVNLVVCDSTGKVLDGLNNVGSDIIFFERVGDILNMKTIVLRLTRNLDGNE